MYNKCAINAKDTRGHGSEKSDVLTANYFFKESHGNSPISMKKMSSLRSGIIHSPNEYRGQIRSQ